MLPHVVRQMTDQQLVKQIGRPENIANQQDDQVMVVIPAYH
jgi:hypothetical protein